MVVSQTNWRRQCTCITWTIISIHAKSIVLRSLVLEYELFCDCTLAHRRTQALYSTWFARYLVMHNPNVQSTLFHWIHVICVAVFFGTFANCCQMRTLILFLYHVCITLDARMHPKSLLNSCDLHFSGFGWFCCTPCSFYYLSITIYSIHLHWYLRTEIDRMNEKTM